MTFASNMVRSHLSIKRVHLLRAAKDIIIAEDDPYFFLQVGEYVPKSERKAAAADNEDDNVARFVASLIPSYLRIDTQGRVIRMDTFSKVRRLGSLTHSLTPLILFTFQSFWEDDCTRRATRLGHMQPALRGATRAHGRDVYAVAMRTRSITRRGASLTVDVRRLRTVVARSTHAVYVPPGLFRRLSRGGIRLVPHARFGYPRQVGDSSGWGREDSAILCIPMRGEDAPAVVFCSPLGGYVRLGGDVLWRRPG